MVNNRDVKFLSHFWKVRWVNWVPNYCIQLHVILTDEQNEVVNRTLVSLLRVIISKNIKSGEECLPFVEFAYNRIIHSTTHYSHFEVVYGFNPPTPLDLLLIPFNIFVSEAATNKADLIKT